MCLHQKSDFYFRKKYIFSSVVKGIQDLISNLSLTAQLKVPRYVNPTLTMYCFSDASITGYGYVIYVGPAMIFGKSKLSPKGRTIVDLELLALYELAMGVKRIRGREFSGNVIFMTDSQMNIDRLKSCPSKFPVSVAHRIMRIQQIGPLIEASFCHIPGELNVADLYSRGCNLNELTEKPSWKVNRDDLPKMVKMTQQRNRTMEIYRC